MRITTDTGLTLDFDMVKEWDDVSSFECRDGDLNDFLWEDAVSAQASRFSVTWIVRKKGVIVGFCTLTNDSIRSKIMQPEDREDNFIYSHYPALKIARLATHRDHEGQDIGTTMLEYATAVALKLSDDISGCRILTVDSKKNSVGFYQKFGFELAKINTKNIETIPLYKDILRTRVRDE